MSSSPSSSSPSSSSSSPAGSGSGTLQGATVEVMFGQGSGFIPTEDGAINFVNDCLAPFHSRSINLDATRRGTYERISTDAYTHAERKVNIRRLIPGSMKPDPLKIKDAFNYYTVGVMMGGEFLYMTPTAALGLGIYIYAKPDELREYLETDEAKRGVVALVKYMIRTWRDLPNQEDAEEMKRLAIALGKALLKQDGWEGSAVYLRAKAMAQMSEPRGNGRVVDNLMCAESVLLMLLFQRGVDKKEMTPVNMAASGQAGEERGAHSEDGSVDRNDDYIDLHSPLVCSIIHSVSNNRWSARPEEYAAAREASLEKDPRPEPVKNSKDNLIYRLGKLVGERKELEAGRLFEDAEDDGADSDEEEEIPAAKAKMFKRFKEALGDDIEEGVY